MSMEKRIERVRTELVLYYPFIASLLFGLEQVVDNTMPNLAAVSTRCLFLNLERIEEKGLSNCQLLFLLAHEALHPALMHLQRMGNRLPSLWNVATDAVVNHYTLEMGLEPIAGTIPPIADKDAETIYSEMLDKALPCPQCGDLRVEISSDGDIDAPSFGESAKGEGSNDSEGESCETCSAPSRFDKHHYTSETEANAEASIWQRRAVSAAYAAQQRQGKIPGKFVEEIDKLVQARVDWRSNLCAWLQTSKGDDDLTWIPPKKNRIHLGYLPSQMSERCDCVIGVDTSGSISTEGLQWALGEIVALASLYCDTLKIITFDAKIHDEFDIMEGEGLDKIKMRGRGGTNFHPFFERLENLSCDVAIVFTDTFGPFPSKAPLVPTVMAGMAYDNKPPPWAKYILVEG